MLQVHHATRPGTDQGAMSAGSREMPIRRSQPCPHPTLPTSPLLLTEGLCSLEPSSKWLHKLRVVLMCNHLEKLELHHYFHFLKQRDGHSAVRVWVGDASRGLGGGEEWGRRLRPGSLLTWEPFFPPIPSRPCLFSQLGVNSASSRKLSLMPLPLSPYNSMGFPCSVYQNLPLNLRPKGWAREVLPGEFLISTPCPAAVPPQRLT